jgi:hypothetical protein
LLSKKIDSDSQFNLKVVGGNSEFANDIKDPITYQRWAEGIKDKPVLCDFDEESLIPIWTLTMDINRKKELEKYFNENILSAHAIQKPVYEKPIIVNYQLYVYGLFVVNDCETVIMSPGEFEYTYSLKVNDVEKYNSGPIRKDIYENQWCLIEKTHPISFAYSKENHFSFKFQLREIDDIGGIHDILQPNPLIKEYKYPFSSESLSNYQDEKAGKWNRYILKQDDLCQAILLYQIFVSYDPSALKLGNEGWKEFEKGNYDKCVTLSKQGLEIDYSMFFAHFNIALVSLIKGDPLSVSKYKSLIQMCGDKETITGALDDITNYESSKGLLKNSSEIKDLLKLRLAEL